MTQGVCAKTCERLRDYASANEAPLGCSCGNCAQCAASYLTPDEAEATAQCIETLQRELYRLRAALQEISGYRLHQFAGPHDMAGACVHVASNALCGFGYENRTLGAGG